MAEYTIDKIEYGGNVYKLQDNVSGYTANTGTVTSVGISNATNGGLSISGSPITSSGTISVGHSNVLSSAQTTQAVYPIKIDKNGHISAYGSAVTIPTIPSNNVTGSGSTDYLARWSGTNTLSSTSLSISTSYNSSSDEYGTIKLYVGSTGQINWKGQLVFYEGNSSKTVTITPPSLTASRTITLPDKTGTIALTSDLPTVPSNIVNTITTTAGAHTAITNATGAVSFKVPTTAAHVGAATSDHVHGNITNGGDITATAPTIASGDQIVINDNSASKITNGPTFDGSTTTTALTPKGTWETFSKFSGSYNDLSDKPTIPTLPSNIVNTITTTAGTHTAITSQKGNVSFNVPTNTSHLTNDSGFVTTDTKVSTAAITSTVIYYPVLGSDTTAATTKFYDNTGFKYHQRTGTTSVEGEATLTLGNNISTGTAGNKKGHLVLYSKNSYNVSIFADNLTAARTLTLPNKSGTIALTSDLSSYLKKPTDNVNFGWVLHTDGSNDSTYWNPPETFIIGVTDDSDNPGSYTLINTPDDIREAWNSGSAFILDLNMYNSSTAYFDTYRIMNYAMQYQSEGYHVLSFNGNINYYDATTQYTTVKTVVCTIYLDENEQYRTDGEVFVKINDDVAINGDIIVRGHGSPIGDRVQKEGGTDWTTNVPQTGYTTAGTWYQLGTISLTKGRWIIIARARFTPETSGNHYSSINISTTPRLEAVRDRKYGTGTYYNQHSTAMIVGLAEDAIVCVNGTSSVSGVWTRTNNSAFTIDAIRIM